LSLAASETRRFIVTRLLLTGILILVVSPTRLNAQPAPTGSENTAAPRAMTRVPARETRLFELRTNHAAEGKLEALHERFRDHTIRLLARHGIECVGFWVPRDNGGSNLVVLHAYPSAAARTAAWERFAIDPEWRKLRVRTEADGKLVDQIDEVILTPTEFCPAVAAAADGRKRCYELRIVRGGNPAAVAARYRDNVLPLLVRHGLTHVGTWTPAGGKMADSIALVSLVCCDSAEAHAKAVRSFRDDPFWSTVLTESDAGWQSLQDGGDCLLLAATDYSSLR
jgi:hypothetical protein